MSPKKFFHWSFAILSLLNIHHAFAGNSTDRGGGNFNATVASMLPKSIYASLQVDFRNANTRPYQGCLRYSKFFNECKWARVAEEAQIDLGFKLDPSAQSPHFVSTFFSAQYLEKGNQKVYPFYLVMRDWQIYDGTIEVVPSLTPTPAFRHGTGTVGTFDDLLFINHDVRPDGSTRYAVPAATSIDHEVNALDRLVDWFGATHRVEVRLDGVRVQDRHETLPGLFTRIAKTLQSQADFNSIESSRQYVREMRALQIAAVSVSGLAPLTGEIQVEKPSAFLLRSVSSDKASILALALSAVDKEGHCDPSIYAQVLGKLENWIAGSSSFFYELDLDGGSYFEAEAAIRATGIRQALRKDLNRMVVPYCEGSGLKQSKVDLLLND